MHEDFYPIIRSLTQLSGEPVLLSRERCKCSAADECRVKALGHQVHCWEGLAGQGLEVGLAGQWLEVGSAGQWLEV